VSIDAVHGTDDEHLADKLAPRIAHGGDLEHDVQQLADVMGVWRAAPLPERAFLRVDHLAAGQLVRVLRLVLKQQEHA